MFAGCSRRSPKNFNHGLSPLPLSRLIRLRFSSSVPERTRKLPNAPKSFISSIVHGYLLSPWFWSGVASGVAISQYYIRSQNDSFIAYTLVDKEPVSSTASIFHLESKQQSENHDLYKQAWRSGIWNVQFKQPQLQIVRAYTPLPPGEGKNGEENNALRFLVRHDPHGEVSSYLHRLPTTSEVEVRGPYLEYEITPDVRQVVFFAGGTGIAPALQIAHALFESTQNKERKLHILWANRMREDCLGGISDEPAASYVPPKPTWSGFFLSPKPKPTPPAPATQKGPIVQELDALKRKYPGQVTVEYFVNAEDTFIDDDAVDRALSRFDDKVFSAGDSSSNSSQVRQILISGPPGFIAHLAGPKEWRNGREEQGAVSKVLAHALSKNPHHVKVWKI